MIKQHHRRHESSATLTQPADGQVLRSLNRLKTLPADWDGPNSAPTNKDCFQRALEFARRAEEIASANNKLVPKPHVAPTRRGGVLFQWSGKETDGRELAIAFEPEQVIECFIVDEPNSIDDEFNCKTLDEALKQFEWLLG